ncbi:hypothetical protein AB0M34_27445 [Nocardia sp. NPDC050193]
MQTELTNTLGGLDVHRRRLTELDAALEDRDCDLRELIDTRAIIERNPGLYDQIAMLEKME